MTAVELTDVVASVVAFLAAGAAALLMRRERASEASIALGVAGGIHLGLYAAAPSTRHALAGIVVAVLSVANLQLERQRHHS